MQYESGFVDVRRGQLRIFVYIYFLGGLGFGVWILFYFLDFIIVLVYGLFLPFSK